MLRVLLTMWIGASALGAQQQPSSPINDLIAQVTNHVNDFEYAEAIALGQASGALVRQMRPDQLFTFRIVMASAYFPDDTPQYPDQALLQLDDAIRLRPDARIPAELRWPGLDSLLSISRSRIFSVASRPSAEHALVGADGRSYVEAISSRPARFRLVFVSTTTGRVVAHDSTGPSTTARLGFRAHDGVAPLFVTGPYEMRVHIVDAVRGDSTVLRFSSTADGTPPNTLAMPQFDETKLLSEFERPARASIVAKGLVFGALTFGIANFARADEPLRSAHPADGRALYVSVAMLGAMTGALLTDKGRPLPQNAIANERARLTHEQSIVAAAAENRKRISEYRVSLRIAAEPIR